MPSREAGRHFWISLALFVLILLGAWMHSGPRAEPKPPNAPPDQFSAGRAAAVLGHLLRESVPHPIESAANDRVRTRILDELRRLGYEPQIQTAESARDGWAGTVQNILARLEGRSGLPAIALVSHYDSNRRGPGAADAGAGVATILEIARILKEGLVPDHDVIFLLTDGEEAGSLGARAFVESHPWVKDIGVIINLEARGTSGPSLMFETSDGNAGLIDIYARSVRRPATASSFVEVYKRMPNSTDLRIFKEHGLAGYNFAFIRDVRNYHTPDDNLKNLDLRSLQQYGDNVLDLVRGLDCAEGFAPSKNDAMHFDVYGYFTARWSESTSRLATCLACFLLGILLRRMHRRGLITIPNLGWGLIVIPAVAALSGLIGYAMDLAARKAGWLQYPWPPHPLPWLIACWLAGGLAVYLSVTFIARRTNDWNLWSAVWIWMSAFALITTFFMKGWNYVFLLPSVAAVGAGWLISTKAPYALTLLPAAAGLLIWLPYEWTLYDALGINFIPLVTVRAAVILSVFSPIVWSVRIADPAPARRGKIVFILTAGACSAMFLCALLAPGEKTYDLQTHPAKTLANYGEWKSKSISERIVPAPSFVADYIHKDNLNDHDYADSVTLPYTPDSDFLLELRGLVDAWPRELHELLLPNLVGVFFCSNTGGSGYADRIDPENGEYRGFVVIDENAVSRAANKWASWKDGTVFLNSPGGEIRIVIESPEHNTRARAVEFILLHELGHHVGFARAAHDLAALGGPKPTDPPDREMSEYPFYKGRWAKRVRTDEYALPTDTDGFQYMWLSFYQQDERRKRDFIDAAKFYSNLSKTSYPTLYAGTNHYDHFAESFVSYIHCIVQRRPYRVSILQDGNSVIDIGNGILDDRCAADRDFMRAFLSRISGN